MLVVKVSYKQTDRETDIQTAMHNASADWEGRLIQGCVILPAFDQL